MQFIRKWSHAVIFIVALVLFASVLQSKIAKAGPPTPCPLIYAPVICDHDKIYPNQCEADKHHAKNCEPYPII